MSSIRNAYKEILASTETRDPQKVLEVMIDILARDFPCEDMQKLAKFVKRFASSGGSVRVAADEGGSVASISYIIEEEDRGVTFLVPHRRILKRKFEDRVRENLPLEWGAVICAASHIRDCSVEKYGYEAGETKVRQLRAGVFSGRWAGCMRRRGLAGTGLCRRFRWG